MQRIEINKTKELCVKLVIYKKLQKISEEIRAIRAVYCSEFLRKMFRYEIYKMLFKARFETFV
jgi:hypothetical protein